MKTTVEISDVLFERARIVAKQRGTTMRALIEAGLTAVLAPAKPQKIMPLPACSFGGAAKFPVDYVLPKSNGREFDTATGQLVKRKS
jgi:hypothetical protein